MLHTPCDLFVPRGKSQIALNSSLHCLLAIDLQSYTLRLWQDRPYHISKMPSGKNRPCLWHHRLVHTGTKSLWVDIAIVLQLQVCKTFDKLNKKLHFNWVICCQVDDDEPLKVDLLCEMFLPLTREKESNSEPVLWLTFGAASLLLTAPCDW